MGDNFATNIVPLRGKEQAPIGHKNLIDYGLLHSFLARCLMVSNTCIPLLPQRGSMFVTNPNSAKKLRRSDMLVPIKYHNRHIAPKGAKNTMAILTTNILPLRGKEQAAYYRKIKTKLITSLFLLFY